MSKVKRQLTKCFTEKTPCPVDHTLHTITSKSVHSHIRGQNFAEHSFIFNLLTNSKGVSNNKKVPTKYCNILIDRCAGDNVTVEYNALNNSILHIWLNTKPNGVKNSTGNVSLSTDDLSNIMCHMTSYSNNNCPTYKHSTDRFTMSLDETNFTIQVGPRSFKISNINTSNLFMAMSSALEAIRILTVQNELRKRVAEFVFEITEHCTCDSNSINLIRNQILGYYYTVSEEMIEGCYNSIMPYNYVISNLVSGESIV